MTGATSKCILRIDGRNKQIPCEQSKTILHSLIEGGVFLEANCGGRGTCGKCKIQVVRGEVLGKEGKKCRLIKIINIRPVRYIRWVM